MDCVEIQDLILTDYLDGNLAGEGQTSFEQHLAECAACREVLVSVLSNENILRDLPDVVPPPRVWQEIARRVDGPEGTGWERVWNWLAAPRPAMALAMMVVIAAIVLKLAIFGDESFRAKSEAQNKTFVAVLFTEPEEFYSGFGTAAEDLLEI